MTLKIILWLLGGILYTTGGLFATILIASDLGGQGSLPNDYSSILKKVLNFSSEKVLGIVAINDLTMIGVALTWPIVLLLKFLKL